MRIAFAYDAPYPWHVGGIEAMNYNEALELAKRNEVHYFTMRWPGMKAEFIKDGITYHALHYTDQGKLYRHGRRSIREAIAYSLSLTRLFGSRFDVVITNAFPILHLPLVKLYCKMTGAKLIVQVAEVWDRGYWESYLGRFMGKLACSYSNSAIKGADFYVTISSTTSSKLQGLGIARSKMEVFSPAIDDRAIKKVPKAKREKRALFSGRLIKEKRLDKWIEAMKKASSIDPGMRGVIIGKGPESGSLSSAIKREGLLGKVQLRGFYESQSRLYREIKSSSLTLQMSQREGLSIIAIESVALGTPVLLPSYTPLPKEVRDMCIVVAEKDIPNKMVEMARSRDKSRYIKNRQNLMLYSKSRVNDFYSSLMSRI